MSVTVRIRLVFAIGQDPNSHSGTKLDNTLGTLLGCWNSLFQDIVAGEAGVNLLYMMVFLYQKNYLGEHTLLLFHKSNVQTAIYMKNSRL